MFPGPPLWTPGWGWAKNREEGGKTKGQTSITVLKKNHNGRIFFFQMCKCYLSLEKWLKQFKSKGWLTGCTEIRLKMEIHTCINDPFRDEPAIVSCLLLTFSGTDLFLVVLSLAGFVFFFFFLLWSFKMSARILMAKRTRKATTDICHWPVPDSCHHKWNITF